MKAALLFCVSMLAGCGGGGPLSLNLFPQSSAPPPAFGDAPTHGNEMAGPSSPTSAGAAAPARGSGPAPVARGGGTGGAAVGQAIGAVAAGVGVAATAVEAATTLECQPGADQPSDDGKTNLCTRGQQ